MKWYGIVKIEAIGYEVVRKLKKVSLDFPEGEDINVIAAILAQQAWFKDGKEVYAEYLKEKPTDEEEMMEFLPFYTNVIEGIVEKTDSSLSVVAEEWYGGFATSREEAQESFDRASADAGESDEWDESKTSDSIENAIDSLVEKRYKEMRLDTTVAELKNMLFNVGDDTMTIGELRTILDKYDSDANAMITIKNHMDRLENNAY